MYMVAVSPLPIILESGDSIASTFMFLLPIAAKNVCVDIVTSSNCCFHSEMWTGRYMYNWWNSIKK